MAEWSQLPEEILLLIAQRLNTHLDLRSLRSVCSSWRVSVPSKHQPYPPCFPIFSTKGISWSLYLSRRTILSLGLPQSNGEPTITSWLIKLEEDVPGMTHLVNPLSTIQFHLPPNFPKIFDFSRFRVSELGQEYALRYMNHRPSGQTEEGSWHMGKVIFSGLRGGEDFVMLTIHVTGELAMLRRGNKRLIVIDNTPLPPSRWDDLILFDGKFCAVDEHGRTVVASTESPPVLSLIADPVFGGDEKRLVECDGELLMVDTYFGNDIHRTMRRAIGFKVFKLDPTGNEWVEVENLGDRMVFLGERSTFSAPASEFSGCKGNCIYHTNSFFFCSAEEDEAYTRMGVFNLENGTTGALSTFPEYSQVIWPPPPWIYT